MTNFISKNCKKNEKYCIFGKISLYFSIYYYNVCDFFIRSLKQNINPAKAGRKKEIRHKKGGQRAAERCYDEAITGCLTMKDRNH
jgi:hypothetical protein